MFDKFMASLDYALHKNNLLERERVLPIVESVDRILMHNVIIRPPIYSASASVIGWAYRSCRVPFPTLSVAEAMYTSTKIPLAIGCIILNASKLRYATDSRIRAIILHELGHGVENVILTARGKSEELDACYDRCIENIFRLVLGVTPSPGLSLAAFHSPLTEHQYLSHEIFVDGIAWHLLDSCNLLDPCDFDGFSAEVLSKRPIKQESMNLFLQAYRTMDTRVKDPTEIEEHIARRCLVMMK